VAHDDAKGPAPIKVRRQRKVAGVGVVGEQARRSQELGTTIDALVRALTHDDALAMGLGRRVHAQWLEEPGAVLEFQPTELRSEGRLVLAGDAQNGRFILPAYGAGLRLIAIRVQSVPADVVRLARWFCELQADADVQSEFADWLWRGGALGFDVVQTENTAELGECLLRIAGSEAELWTERSAQAVAVWNEMAWTAAQSCDADTLGTRYREPMQRFEQDVQRPELALTRADAQGIRAAADDAIAWALAEVDLLVQEPGLRGVMPRAHLTWQLLSLIEHGTPLSSRTLERFAELEVGPARDGDAVDHALLGAAFARQVLAHGCDADRLRSLVDRAQPAFASGLLEVLLEPGEQLATACDALASLLRHWRAEVFFSRADPPRLSPEIGSVLLGVAFALGTPAAQLGAVLEHLPIASALRAAAAHPGLLRMCSAPIARRINDSPRDSGPLLAGLARSSADAARLVGGVLLARQGNGFGPEALRAALTALAQAGQGSEFVVPLWEARGHATHVRLAALYALDADRPLLAQVVARRVGNLLEPAEIREAIEELRWRQP
jgi:hypothetical protein